MLSVQAVQVMHHPSLKSDERYVDPFAVYYRIYCRSSASIPQHKEREILFHVILNTSVWDIKDDDFQLSLVSPEIDEGNVPLFQRSLYFI